MVHIVHIAQFWSVAPPEASIVHAVCLAEGHPNSPYIKRSKRDCGLRVSIMSENNLAVSRTVDLVKICQIVK